MKKAIYRQQCVALVALTTAPLWGGDALAAGCVMKNVAKYQIGQTSRVTVSNDIAVGDSAADGSARGEGKVLLECQGGLATFRGRLEDTPVGDLIPLTVHGNPSGFGVRLTMQEESGGPVLSFPHDFTRTFNAGDKVTSDSDIVTYDIIRMPGKVAFGKVDMKNVAEQNVSTPTGGMVVFRSMVIYDLTFVRPTCTIDESINQTVHIGDFNPSNFATPDRATPWKEFKLRVLECKEPLGMIAQFTFGNAADADANMPSVFSMAGTGSENVGLELGDKDHKTMEPGELVEMNALAAGEEFLFHARLRETRLSVIGGGTFSRPVKVQVDFY